jgi:hypothetical protein
MKQFITITFLLFFVNIVNSQVHKHTLGLHYPGTSLKNTEISYQFGLNKKNRLEFGLGYRQGRFESFHYIRLRSSLITSML